MTLARASKEAALVGTPNCQNVWNILGDKVEFRPFLEVKWWSKEIMAL